MSTKRTKAVLGGAPAAATTGLIVALLAGPSGIAEWSCVVLAPSGSTSSHALAAWGDEQIGAASIGGRLFAGIWSGAPDTWSSLHPWAAFASVANAGTAGQQAGYATFDGVIWLAGIWSGSPSTWASLHPAFAPHVLQSRAWDTTGAQQAGWVSFGTIPYFDEVPHAALWRGTAESWVDLHPSGAISSEARGIAGGQQVGWVCSDLMGYKHAALWAGTPDSWVDLHPSGAISSEAWDTAGEQQVGFATGYGPYPQGGLWAGTSASWINLNPPGALGSYVLATTGTYQVGYAIFGSPPDAEQAEAGIWNGTAESWFNLHEQVPLPSRYAHSHAWAASDTADALYVAGRALNTISGEWDAVLWTFNRRSAVFRGLGEIPGGITGSQAYGVSADALVVVGASPSDDFEPWQAFRWAADTGMQGLGDLPGGQFRSFANAISADGTVIVGYGTTGSSPSDNIIQATRWTASGGMQCLGDLAGGSFESVAYGVSADGAVIVGYGHSAYGQEAFRWTATGGMQGLGDLPGGDFASIARAVSADGAVIVGWATWGAWWADQHYAFRWTAADGMVPLGALPGAPAQTSRAYGVSPDGSVVVGWSSSPRGNWFYRAEAFRWTAEEGMQPLGDLPGGPFDSWAWAASRDGSVIVGTSLTDSDYNQAFIWDAAHGMRHLKTVLETEYGLNLTGWELEYATAVSPDGRAIVGFGYNPQGWREAWLAVLPPALCLGDMNCDGIVSYADIDWFIDALAGQENWTHEPCPWLNGDCNGDGMVTYADIDPFIARLGTACP